MISSIVIVLFITLVILNEYISMIEEEEEVSKRYKERFKDR